MADSDDSDWGKLATVGFEVAVGVGLGAAVGIWVDRRFRCAPWGVVIGAIVGCAAGMYVLIRDVMKADH